MSDHGHQPCTRALNMNRVLEQLGYLHQGRGSALIGLLAWGRVRSLARVAYDRLGLHGKVAVPTAPIDWAQTRAYTSVVSTGEGVSLALRGPRARGHGRPRRTTSASAPSSPPRSRGSPIPPPASIRSGAPCRREQVLSGAYLDRAPDLLLEAAPLYSLTHARQMVEAADWLSGDHRPEGVYVAAGPRHGAGGRLRDRAHRLRRASSPPAAGVEADAAGPAAAGRARRRRCSPTRSSARSRSACAGWATSK